MMDLFDVTIVGGGPTGLYGAYYAGLRGMKTKIIDTLPELGGQLVALYPEKLIYDVAGFPEILAEDLARNLITQARRYKSTICLEEKILHMDRLGHDGGTIIRLRTDKGNEHYTRALLLTVGIGAFTPKRLSLPDVDRFEGKGIYYYVKRKSEMRDKRVLIVGGGDSALDWATTLSGIARSIILIHRREHFRAHENNVRELHKSSVVMKVPFELKAVYGNDSVESVTVINNTTKEEETLPVDCIVLSLGFHVTVGPLKEWGIELEKNDVKVNTRMESSLPGVYAAGDIAWFPGKLKLIVTGFGEAAIAVNTIKTYIDPKAKYYPGHSSDRNG